MAAETSVLFLVARFFFLLDKQPETSNQKPETTRYIRRVKATA